MNTLQKILNQECFIGEEQIKLLNLQKQYIKENAKYKKGEIVLFYKNDYTINPIRGIVQFIRFNNIHEKGLIQYAILRINKDGSLNRHDTCLYYIHEKQINKC